MAKLSWTEKLQSGRIHEGDLLDEAKNYYEREILDAAKAEEGMTVTDLYAGDLAEALDVIDEENREQAERAAPVKATEEAAKAVGEPEPWDTLEGRIDILRDELSSLDKSDPRYGELTGQIAALEDVRSGKLSYPAPEPATDLQEQFAAMFAKTATPVFEKQNAAIAVCGDTITTMAREARVKDALIDRLNVEIAGLRQGVMDDAEKLPGHFRAAPEIQKLFGDLDGRIKGLEHAAWIDQLTGLHNRHFLDMLLSSRRASENGLHLAVLSVDIDHFKRVNDKYGHQAGDDVLRGVAAKMREVAKSSFTEPVYVVRQGGEEFLVLAGIKAGKAQAATQEIVDGANRLRTGVRELNFKSVGGPEQVTVSIGIADSVLTLPSKDKGFAVLNSADKCLYVAKDAGRNRVMTNPAMLSQSIEAITPGTGGEGTPPAPPAGVFVGTERRR